MSVIPLQEIVEYTLRIDLDEITNDLRIYWTEFSAAMADEMDTGGFWSMDISNRLFNIKAIKLIGGVELMWPYSQVNFGGFYLYDMSTAAADPEFAGIGTRWQLDYIPVSELLVFRQGLKLETI